jgi:hypothetical protein
MLEASVDTRERSDAERNDSYGQEECWGGCTGAGADDAETLKSFEILEY